MAKPKSPLLSLGARGTIADTLTFQKRVGATIARRKPIPTDPKSDAQLAQRQIYREAVDAWNSLTPEEQEAWRGVYPGLTAYQGFMRYKIRELLTPPPPEEYTEEQLVGTYPGKIYSPFMRKRGQKLIIPNRKVTKLGFWMKKDGLPAGDLIFEIARVSDDSPICSKVWGDAADLPLDDTYEEVEFDDPPTINEEVRLYAAFYAGNSTNCPSQRYSNEDEKADEYFVYFMNYVWEDAPTSDCVYRYKYYLP